MLNVLVVMLDMLVVMLDILVVMLDNLVMLLGSPFSDPNMSNCLTTRVDPVRSARQVSKANRGTILWGEQLTTCLVLLLSFLRGACGLPREILRFKGTPCKP